MENHIVLVLDLSPHRASPVLLRQPPDFETWFLFYILLTDLSLTASKTKYSDSEKATTTAGTEYHFAIMYQSNVLLEHPLSVDCQQFL